MGVTSDVAMPCSYFSRITEEIISYRFCPGGSAICEVQIKKAYGLSNNMPESTQERPTQKTTAQYLKKEKLQATLERLFPGQKHFDIRVSRNMHSRLQHFNSIGRKAHWTCSRKTTFGHGAPQEMSRR